MRLGFAKTRSGDPPRRTSTTAIEPFGGSTFAGTKALLELNKISDKDVQYISIPGSSPKIAAMQQGIIQAALLAPPSDYTYPFMGEE